MTKTILKTKRSPGDVSWRKDTWVYMLKLSRWEKVLEHPLLQNSLLNLLAAVNEASTESELLTELGKWRAENSEPPDQAADKRLVKGVMKYQKKGELTSILATTRQT